MYGWDLIFAILSITVLSVSAYLAGKSLGARVCKTRPWLFLEALAFTLIFGWFFAGRLIWANAISGSAVIYWSNLMPILLVFTAGLACATPGLTRWRRPLTVTLLAAIAIGHLVIPVMRPLLAPAHVVAASQWRDNICLQTHSATCGAAATATLLNLRGIPADEQTMIDACLTSRHGTEPLGLYRGLKLASQGFDHQVKVACRNPNDWLERNQLPNLALVRFANSSESGPIRWLLGPRGEGHAVVVLGREGDQWIIGDPAVGKVRWSHQDFRRRFTGDAIYLSR